MNDSQKIDAIREILLKWSRTPIGTDEEEADNGIWTLIHIANIVGSKGK